MARVLPHGSRARMASTQGHRSDRHPSDIVIAIAFWLIKASRVSLEKVGRRCSYSGGASLHRQSTVLRQDGGEGIERF
jgi:hypothetical protein